MLKEFDSVDAGGPRSAANYAYDGFRPHQTNVLALVASGLWQTRLAGRPRRGGQAGGGQHRPVVQDRPRLRRLLQGRDHRHLLRRHRRRGVGLRLHPAAVGIRCCGPTCRVRRPPPPTPAAPSRPGRRRRPPPPGSTSRWADNSGERDRVQGRAQHQRHHVDPGGDGGRRT